MAQFRIRQQYDENKHDSDKPGHSYMDEFPALSYPEPGKPINRKNAFQSLTENFLTFSPSSSLEHIKDKSERWFMNTKSQAVKAYQNWTENRKFINDAVSSTAPLVMGVLLAGTMLSGYYLYRQNHQTKSLFKSNIKDMTEQSLHGLQEKFNKAKNDITPYFAYVSSLFTDKKQVETIDTAPFFTDTIPTEEPVAETQTKWKDEVLKSHQIKQVVAEHIGSGQYSISPLDEENADMTFGRYGLSIDDMQNLLYFIPILDDKNPDTLSLSCNEEWRNQNPKSEYLTLPDPDKPGHFIHYRWAEGFSLHVFLNTQYGYNFQDNAAEHIWSHNHYFLQKYNVADHVDQIVTAKYVDIVKDNHEEQNISHYLKREPIVITQTGLQLLAHKTSTAMCKILMDKGFKADRTLPKEIQENFDDLVQLMILGADMEYGSHKELLVHHKDYDEYSMHAYKEPISNNLFKQSLSDIVQRGDFDFQVRVDKKTLPQIR